MAKIKILIVDDEKMTRDAMCRALSRTYDCLSAADPELALAILDENPDTAVLLTDYKMPVMNGQELIIRAKGKHPHLVAILITAFAEIELAVEAMKHGANDFISKPITDLEGLIARIDGCIKTSALVREVTEQKGGRTGEIADFTGQSPAMEQVYRLIRKVAPTHATVLVEGPSGTGKELVARALHSLSPRAKGPFVAVECAALSRELLESELFGYAPGTFTGGLKDGKAGCFETASGGTLFLDEIGEIGLDTQVKLLRAIESRTVVRLGSSKAIPVDFRLVTATNRNLAEMVARGTFREDLYYRLHVIDIATPALKDHPEDIPLLASRFLKEFSSANGGAVADLSPEALKSLQSYPWPGNVRQLRNVIEKMVILATGPTLTVADLPPEITAGVESSTDRQPPPLNSHPSAPNPAATTLDETEKTRILATLEACGKNKSKAAVELGISRRTIHRKLKEWGLS